MAKQDGIIPLKGAIDKITFSKTKTGYKAGKKSEISPARIANDPRLLKVRQQGQEFSRAASGSKTLRTSVFGSLNKSRYQQAHTRLVRVMNKVIKSDRSHGRGDRTITDGNLALLEKFNFNEKAQFNATFFAPHTVNVDRAAGQLRVDVPAFVTKDWIKAPQGATHFRLVASGAAVRFEDENFVSNHQSTDVFLLSQVNSAAINLTASIPSNSTGVLFLVLGICFYTDIDGPLEDVSNGDQNALCIVAVSAV